MEYPANVNLKRVCPVCTGDDCEDLFRPVQSPGPIIKCRNCGFVYVNPIETTKALIHEGPVLGDRPSNLLESSDLTDIEGSWEQSIIETHLRELRAKQLNAQDTLRHINHLIQDRGMLLDVGCFCGVFLNQASQAGYDCRGIEPLVMPAIYARGHFGLSVVTDTLRNDSYPPETFDVVTLFQVLEHIIHPAYEIEIIHRILKHEGLLLIEVPRIDTLMVRLLGAKHRHFVQDHVSFFSVNTLGILLNRLGFVVRTTFFPTRLMSIRHILWWLERSGKRIGKHLSNALPPAFLDRHIPINLRDIITVIAEKEHGV